MLGKSETGLRVLPGNWPPPASPILAEPLSVSSQRQQQAGVALGPPPLREGVPPLSPQGWSRELMVLSPHSSQRPGPEQRSCSQHPIPEPVPGLEQPQKGAGAGAGAGAELNQDGLSTRYVAPDHRLFPSEHKGNGRWTGCWRQRPLEWRNQEGPTRLPGCNLGLELLLGLLLDGSSFPDETPVWGSEGRPTKWVRWALWDGDTLGLETLRSHSKDPHPPTVNV